MRQGRGPLSSVHRRLRARVLSRSSPQARGASLDELVRKIGRGEATQHTSSRRSRSQRRRTAKGGPTRQTGGSAVRSDGYCSVRLRCEWRAMPSRRTHRRPASTSAEVTQTFYSGGLARRACLVSRLNSIAPPSSSNFNECSSIWAFDRAVARFLELLASRRPATGLHLVEGPLRDGTSAPRPCPERASVRTMPSPTSVSRRRGGDGGRD